MEQALFISKPDTAHYLTEDFTRLYYGQEFCERLLPDETQLKEVLSFAQEHRLEITFVTPYVTNRGLAHLERLFGLLSEKKPDIEVVFNDWGVLHLLRTSFPEAQPVLGRLLNKMKRGPRIMNIYEKMPQASQEYFRRSSLDVPEVGAFLLQHGINRVEFDNLLQGISFEGADSRIRKSLYLPFAFVSTTRFCLTANCDDPGYAERIGIFPCGRECQRYTFHLFNPVMTVPLIRKGNTIFFLNERIPESVARHEVDRIVVQPEIPV
ncbi:MAG: hypothetical protein N3B18_12570 [Desulfobacterota bacterium]|nr:hypothetical protein [Thermodesulfobacteriota bacterium]